jgi:PAS domain S-box-containing protein
MLKKSNYWLIAAIAILLVTGTVLTFWTAQQQDRAMREEMLIETRLAAAGISSDQLKTLSGSVADLDTPEYQKLKGLLVDYREADPDIRFTYLIGQRSDGTYFFFVDSEPPESADYSPPGQDYPEVTPLIVNVFSTGKEMTGGPDSDRWGTWVSGIVPVTDPETGKLIAVFGIDVDAGDWTKEMALATIPVVAGVLILLILVLAFFFIHEHNEQERRRIIESDQVLRKSEERYRFLFIHSPIGIVQLDKDGVIVMVNDKYTEIIGAGKEQLIGFNTLAEIRDPDFLSAIQDAMNGRTGLFEGEYTSVLSGRKVFLRMVTQPLGTGESSLSGVIGIIEDITERKRAETALKQMTRRLSLLNYITFNEIENAIFAISGFLTLVKSREDEPAQEYLDSMGESIRRVEKSLTFAKDFQQLGTNIPAWQDVQQSFVFGVSHLNFSSIHRTIKLDNLEIYASPLLERVFFALAKNVLNHAKNATEVTMGYEIVNEGLLLFFRDNGPGIPDASKEKIFEQGYGSLKSMELFLVREILSITGITIRESGTYGEGACFEIFVPNGAYRFPGKQ